MTTRRIGRTETRLPRSSRIAAAVLALVWLGAGSATIVFTVDTSHWWLAVIAAAALWYGLLWLRVARYGRHLTIREALRPWRAGQPSDR